MMKLLLAFAVVGFFAISCGDDDDSPKLDENKNYLKVGETTYDISLGALTSNKGDAEHSTRVATSKYLTPVAFATEGLSFGQDADAKEKEFEIKGEGQIFVINLRSSSFTELDEGTHTISDENNMGVTVHIKIVDEKNPPEISKLVYINEGTVEVKKSEEGYEITVNSKGYNLEELGSVEDLEKLINNDDPKALLSLLAKLKSLKKIEVEGHFKGKLYTFTNVDWSKYMDMEKYAKFLEGLKNLPSF